MHEMSGYLGYCLNFSSRLTVVKDLRLQLQLNQVHVYVALITFFSFYNNISLLVPKLWNIDQLGEDVTITPLVLSVGKVTFKMYSTTDYRIHALKCNL